MNKIKSIYKKNEEVTPPVGHHGSLADLHGIYTGKKILYRNELLTMAGQFPGIRPYGSGRYVMHDHRRY